MKKKIVLLASFAIISATGILFAINNKSNTKESCCTKDKASCCTEQTCNTDCSCGDECTGAGCDCGCSCCE